MLLLILIQNSESSDVLMSSEVHLMSEVTLDQLKHV